MATLTTLLKVGADISDLQTKVSQGVQAMDSLEKNTSKMSSTLSTMGKTLVGALSGAAIMGAVRSFTDLTGQLTDMAAKTGISTTELQKLKFAAEQNGATIDTVTRAIGFMARTLVEGDKGAVGAMQRLGLSLKDVRQMQPGEAFATIADAIAKIPSPMEQSTLMFQAFGKAGLELLPMVKGNLQATMEAAEQLGIVLDEGTVRAGDNFGDTMQVITAVGQSMIANVLKPMLPAFIAVAEVMTKVGGVVQWLQDGFQTLIVWSMKSAKTFVDLVVGVGELGEKMPVLGKAFKALEGDNMAAARATQQWLDDTIKGMQREIPKTVPPITNMRTAIGVTTTEMREATKAAKGLRDAAEDLVERGIKREVLERKKLTDELLKEIPLLQAFVREARDELGVILQIPPIVNDWAAANTATTETLLAMGSAAATVSDATVVTHQEFVKATEKTTSWRESLTGLSEAMTQLSQTAGNAVVSALASMVNAFNVGAKAVDSFKEGFANLTSGKGLSGILQGFAGIVSGIGGIVSAAQAAISIGKALFNIFDRDKGRDLVEDFAKEFGGFDGPNGLHALLLKLGDAGEQLWIKLTQGVGRNNADQARAVIDEVRRAIEGLNRTASEFPGITYHPGMETPEFGGEVPEFAGGSGGIRDFGSGTLAMLHGREAVITESQMAGVGGGTTVIYNYVMLDGRQVGESVTEYQSTRLQQRKRMAAA